MGFDLYGMNPQNNTKKPEILCNAFWDLEESKHEDYYIAQDELVYIQLY